MKNNSVLDCVRCGSSAFLISQTESLCYDCLTSQSQQDQNAAFVPALAFLLLLTFVFGLAFFGTLALLGVIR